MKKKKWGRILSIGFILLSMLIVVLIAFNNPELMNAWDVLFTLDKRWLLLCLLAMVGYVYAEGAGLCTFLRMQIYLMSQRSIPAGVATSALTARYFFNQLTLVVMTLLLWLSNRVYVAEHLGNVIPLIILGCVVNSFCVPSILLVTFHRSWVEKIVQWGIRFLTKIHICKKPEQWQASAETTIEHFHGSLMDLVHHPMHLLAQLVISVVEMSCLMVVPLLVYRAMGLTGTPWYHVLTVSFLLFVSASYTPLPGASGAQEGGFLVYFGSVFTGGTVSVALLVWRFITYYLCLLVGCADSIFTSLRKRVKPIRHEKKGQTKEQS